MTNILVKTFIGRIERGFDVLGYHFGPEGLTSAAGTIGQFVERALCLMSGPDGIDSSTEGVAPPERGYTCPKVGSATRNLQDSVRELSSITS